eukprot:6880729-Karenia_brevis.AAC.1
MPSRGPNKNSKLTRDDHEDGDDCEDVVTMVVFRSPQSYVITHDDCLVLTVARRDPHKELSPTGGSSRF